MASEAARAFASQNGGAVGNASLSADGKAAAQPGDGAGSPALDPSDRRRRTQEQMAGEAARASARSSGAADESGSDAVAGGMAPAALGDGAGSRGAAQIDGRDPGVPARDDSSRSSGRAGASPPMAVSIRAAVAADLPAVQAIYAHYVCHSSASFELEPPDLAEIERRFASVRAAGLPFLVATDAADGVLGYAYVGEYRSRPGYRYCCEHSIYLAPAARGQGLGRELLRALMNAAARAGRTEMIAVVGGGLANPASIALHQALGFRLVGILENVGYKFDRWWDSALLQARLIPNPVAHDSNW